MSFEEIGSITVMTISGFNNIEEILDYVLMIYSPIGYATSFDRVVSFIPISTKNVYTLLHGKTLEEYMSFFVEHYGDKAAGLIARWRIQINNEEVLGEAEDKLIEKAVDLLPNEEDLPQDSVNVKDSIEKRAIEPILTADSIATDTTRLNLAVEPVITTDSITPDKTKFNVADETPTATQPDSVKITTRPKEITMDYLMEQRKLTDQEETARKEEQAKQQEQKRKDTAALRKQQEKERKQLQREKAKAAKEREQQRKKEQREKERLNKQRLKEREAQRRAEQKAKRDAAAQSKR
jgi:flagellar biosynthesis GTPase FlhF